MQDALKGMCAGIAEGCKQYRMPALALLDWAREAVLASVPRLTCSTADRKAAGWEKPASQNTAGGPADAHDVSCASRSRRSLTQASRPFSDAYARRHVQGTCAKVPRLHLFSK